jgi:hypothetical protein
VVKHTITEESASARITVVALHPVVFGLSIYIFPREVLTVYFGTPDMFITLWFGFFYGTNPPLGTLII